MGLAAADGFAAGVFLGATEGANADRVLQYIGPSADGPSPNIKGYLLKISLKP